MEYLLVLVATPLAIWASDRLFYRGEFSAFVVAAITEELNRRNKVTRRGRART